MFLVGRDGETCTRYSNSRTPASIREDVEAALAGKPPPPAPVSPPATPSKQEAVEATAGVSPASVMS